MLPGEDVSTVNSTVRHVHPSKRTKSHGDLKKKPTTPTPKTQTPINLRRNTRNYKSPHVKFSLRQSLVKQRSSEEKNTALLLAGQAAKKGVCLPLDKICVNVVVLSNRTSEERATPGDLSLTGCQLLKVIRTEQGRTYQLLASRLSLFHWWLITYITDQIYPLKGIHTRYSRRKRGDCVGMACLPTHLAPRDL